MQTRSRSNSEAEMNNMLKKVHAGVDSESDESALD